MFVIVMTVGVPVPDVICGDAAHGDSFLRVAGLLGEPARMLYLTERACRPDADGGSAHPFTGAPP
jgi:hypothetical protein